MRRLYLDPPPGTVRVSVDEKTGIQAKSRKHPQIPARPGRDARREFEYVRHGTISIIAAMNVTTGQVIAERISRSNSATFTAFLSMLHQMVPRHLRIHLIMDNGSSHTSARRATAIMDSVPDTPDPQTRTAVTQRITAHVKRGWPHLGEPIVRHRGRFCYVSARLPGEREPAPILRLRYQGSAGQWAIGIYLASTDRYTESELPTSFGPKTGTPEEGIDDTFILYAGPKTGH